MQNLCSGKVNDRAQACGFEMLYQESKGRGIAINPSVEGLATAVCGTWLFLHSSRLIVFQAQARKETLQRNPEYSQYLTKLKASGYFRNELEGSALWVQLEDKAVDAFLEARRVEYALCTCAHKFLKLIVFV